MAKTCASCKYHRCECKCTIRDICCDGFCIKRKGRKKCDQSVCKDYKLDTYFILDD